MKRLFWLPVTLAVSLALVGCNVGAEAPSQPTSGPPASEQPQPTEQGKEALEAPKTPASPEITYEWAGQEVSAHGTYTARQVEQARDRLEEYVQSALVNPVFLHGEWVRNPTGEALAEELKSVFTDQLLEHVTSLDPKSTDPNVLNEVNSVVFLLHPEGQTPVWKDPSQPAEATATDLTFSEETETKALKATFNVELKIPTQSEEGIHQHSVTYIVNTWLVDVDGEMKIDGYVNSWKAVAD